MEEIPLKRRNRLAQLEMSLSKPQSKSSLRMRWTILTCTCVSALGVYYSYDIPSALHQQLKDYMPANPDFEYKFNMLYTLYSLPNIVLPFFGGNLVDKFSAPVCLVVFIFFTLAGQALFAFGVAMESWNCMLLGRLVYGFGGENMCVAQSALIAVWFGGKELALSFGISLSISRLGSVLNNIVSPVVANSSSVPISTFVGVFANAVAFIMTIFLLILDRKATRKCHRINAAAAQLTQSLMDDQDTIDSDYYISEPAMSDRNRKDQDSVSLRDVTKFGKLFWFLALSCVVVYGCVLPFNNVASGILLERNYFTAPNPTCVLTYPDQCTSGTLQNSTNIAYDANGNICPENSRIAPTLPESINITHYSNPSWNENQYVYADLRTGNIDCNDPFWSDACTKDYCDALKSATETTGRIMSIPYFISATISPPLGHFIDKIGRRAIFAALSPLVLFVVHLTLAFSTSSPIVPLIGQGVSYSLFAAVIWPSVPLTVDEKLTGTAFGVVTAIQNLGLSTFPLFVAYLYKLSDGKFIPSVEVFFATLAFMGVVVGIFLNIFDMRSGGRLNRSANSRIESIDNIHDSEDGDGGQIIALIPADDSSYIN